MNTPLGATSGHVDQDVNSRLIVFCLESHELSSRSQQPFHVMQVGSEGLLGDGERTDDLAPNRAAFDFRKTHHRIGCFNILSTSLL